MKIITIVVLDMEADHRGIKLKESPQRFKNFLDLKLEMETVKLFIECYFEEVKPPPHKGILAPTPLPTTLYPIFIKFIRHLSSMEKCYLQA